MSDEHEAFPASEAAPRSRQDVPETERAQEIGREDDADLHGDPESVNESPIDESGLEAIANWRVAKALLTLRAQINALAPARSKVSDGTIGDAAHFKKGSATDHNPWIREGANGVVTAMDVTHSPDKGCDGSAIAAALRKAKDPRVKYIIWNRQIANSAPQGGAPAWGWRPYTGKNPHDHHIHISVKSDKPSYDSESAWALPASLKPGAGA